MKFLKDIYTNVESVAILVAASVGINHIIVAYGLVTFTHSLLVSAMIAPIISVAIVWLLIKIPEWRGVCQSS